MEETIVIKDLGVHGEGVGRLSGLTLFVPGMLPEEEGSVRIVERKKNYARGALVQLSKKAKERCEPVCPLFGRCGGCQLMHLSYEAQLEAKKRRVEEALERIGKIQGYQIFPCVASPEPLAYRNKIQLPVQGAKIGLYARESHDLVEVERCHIHNTLGEEVYGAVRALIQRSPDPHLRHLWIRTSIHKGEVLVALITRRGISRAIRSLAEKIFALPSVVGVLVGRNDREDNVLRPDALKTLLGKGSLEEKMLGIEVEISMESFFQVHTLQAEALYRKAFALAGIKEGTSVLDAYCGVGLFATFLAQAGAHVTGIEVVAQAIESAQRNAEKNKVEAQFLCGKVEDLIGSLPPYDVVFLNPPRKGCEKSVIEALSASPPQKIVYTSCDPATLARDLALFQERGFSVLEVHPFDLFPQTMHVETVALLTKRNVI